MIYFDTAYLVKCYVREAGSEEVRALASRHPRIACSEFGRVELHAAFHRGFREQAFDRHYLQTIWGQFDRDEEDGIWTWLPLTPDILGQVAAAFRTLPPTLHLRTGDAIHLATARTHRIARVFSNDRRLLEAAGEFGLEAENLLGGQASAGRS